MTDVTTDIEEMSEQEMREHRREYLPDDGERGVR